MKKLNEVDLITLNALKDYARSTNNYELMLNCYEELLKREPENFNYIDSCMYASVMSGNWYKAIHYGLKNLKESKFHLNSLDGLSHAYYSIGDYENSCKYGTEALYLRHNEVLKDIELPRLNSQPNQKGKKIISFSLFGGNNPKYIEGAILNTELVDRIYPGWICRFYIDKSIPETAVNRLKKNGAEIIVCDDYFSDIPKTMWRFLALDDEDVSCVIFRDTDSVISPREAIAVSEWLESDKYFNTLRDHGSNTDLIMAGLWGAKCGVLQPILPFMREFVTKGNLHKRFSDQDFLKQCLWKYIVQSLYAVDTVFNFLNPHRFKGKQDVENFVGRTETFSTITIKGNWKKGQKIIWRLHSKIDPLIAESYDKFTLLNKERFICEYETITQNGKVILSNLPKRYIKHFSYSRIEIINIEN